MGAYIESLYDSFFADLDTQKQASKWNKPERIQKRRYVSGNPAVTMGSNPIIFLAQLSELIEIRKEAGVTILKWKTFETWSVDKNFYPFLSEESRFKEAPQIQIKNSRKFIWN